MGRHRVRMRERAVEKPDKMKSLPARAPRSKDIANKTSHTTIIIIMEIIKIMLITMMILIIDNKNNNNIILRFRNIQSEP